MVPLFLNRVFRSVKIDPEVFNEVQKDKNATISAAIVVILSSTAAGIGATKIEMGNFILAPVLQLVNFRAVKYISLNSLSVFFEGLLNFRKPYLFLEI
jgi:hypothetical protein